MPKVEMRARVLLCPVKPDDDTRHLAWPCPPGVAVQLKRKGRGSAGASPEYLQTGDDGVTYPVELDEATYQVTVTEPGYEQWSSEELEAKQAAEPLDVCLIPQRGLCFLVIRLITESGQPLDEGTVEITPAGNSYVTTFTSNPEGYVYALVPPGQVTLGLKSEDIYGQQFCPQDFLVPYTVTPVPRGKVLEFIYWPQITIVATPTVTQPDGTQAALTGTSVPVEYQVSAQYPGTSHTKTLGAGGGTISFEYPFPGVYTATVTPPPTWQNLPITGGQPIPPKTLSAGQTWDVPAEFAVVASKEITIDVKAPQGEQLTGIPQFMVTYGNATTPVMVDPATNRGTARVPADIPSKISLAPGTATLGAVPVKMATSDQAVIEGANTVELEYEYSLTVNALDESDRPVSGAMIDVFDANRVPVGDGVTDENGSFVIGLGGRGTYYVSHHTVAGQPGILERAEVRSPGVVVVRIKGSGGEALTDLAAYPVLTEEVTTTGGPAPSDGGLGGGGQGAGYGQTVDQAMRDVLGWRPGGDIAGFQAALTGAFSLREVEGHTEWIWQQRGYAVQADMGALTGAQASIYARAKSALDQVLPLLAGLTSLNPSLYPPQDLEAIRSVVSAELQELVSELALEGGPRIQRVDELFGLLLGDTVGSTNLNPDVVQGQLGILRTRFGLTVDEIDTIDEERIVTNFRIIVEQVLALQASWSSDRDLLSGVSSRTSLGTILIWLSRSLEAVCESVDDLTFALDSVYVDAAQRQVIELRFAGRTVKVPRLPLNGHGTTSWPFDANEPSLLLSDLLGWIVRASRDEGPRIVQDAGKDGVFAFAPVLDKLRILVHASEVFIPADVTMPTGLRTPRVKRAFQVLAGQLDQAANFARLVQPNLPPEIEDAWVIAHSVTNPKISLVAVSTKDKTVRIGMRGTNFRSGASAILTAQGREDLADLTPSTPPQVGPPSTATATFPNPLNVPNSAGATWAVLLINDDGTQSNEVPV
jgi:hypothetical protein